MSVQDDDRTIVKATGWEFCGLLRYAAFFRLLRLQCGVTAYLYDTADCGSVKSDCPGSIIGMSYLKSYRLSEHINGGYDPSANLLLFRFLHYLDYLRENGDLSTFFACLFVCPFS